MRLPLRARWLLVAVAALLVAVRLAPFREWFGLFTQYLGGLGPAAYALYAAAYVAVTVLLLPAWLMTVGAGFVFGLLPGVAVVSVGSTLGAAAAFLIARHLAREGVARRTAGNPRFAAIDRAIGRKGWKIVFLLRLSPFVPFVLSNYFYGLTAIRFWPYVLSSWIGMIPLTFLYVSLGVAGREASRLLSGPPSSWKWALAAAGIAATLAASLYAARVGRRALDEEEVTSE